MDRFAPLVAAVEAGGTKFNVAVGTGPRDIRAEARIPTTSPRETLSRVIDFFEHAAVQGHRPVALGIGSFGPAEVRPNAPDFGSITNTPKPGWSHTNVARFLSQRLRLPFAFDTDVNAAGIGETRWGAARGCIVSAYVTIGTGIGGGLLVEGRPVYGTLHAEMGHIRIPRGPGQRGYGGTCPFHGDCLEGVASGPAILRRWGAPLNELGPNHPALDETAAAIAHLCQSLILIASPERLILGGGVMQCPGLLSRIRVHTGELLAGYVSDPSWGEGLEGLIQTPMLDPRSGVLGAIAMAQDIVV